MRITHRGYFLVCNMHLLLLAVAAATQQGASASCGGFGDANDWIVHGCDVPAVLTTMGNNFSLSNGIIARSFTIDLTKKLMRTVAITNLVGVADPSIPVDLLHQQSVLPEAAMVINDVYTCVGGTGDAEDGGLDLCHESFTYANHRISTPQKRYEWTPGQRGSNPHAPWPPLGVRVEFDHVLSCSAIMESSLVKPVSIKR